MPTKQIGVNRQMEINCEPEHFEELYAPMVNMDIPDLFKITFTEPKMFGGKTQQREKAGVDKVLHFSGLIAGNVREPIKYDIQYHAVPEGGEGDAYYTYHVGLSCSIDGGADENSVL
jgi:hypothetical protein